MFLAPEHIFSGIVGVRSCFHILLSQTSFRWYLRSRVSFSCFALPNSFSVDPWASAPSFHVLRSQTRFGGTEVIGSRFNVWPTRTRFRRFRGRRVQFSCFTLPDSFSTINGASGPVFMFCAPGLVFIGTEGLESHILVYRSRTSFRRTEDVWSRFHVLRSRTNFQWYQGIGSCFHVS
jgi:hypothetical protein